MSATERVNISITLFRMHDCYDDVGDDDCDDDRFARETFADDDVVFFSRPDLPSALFPSVITAYTERIFIRKHNIQTGKYSKGKNVVRIHFIW